MNTHQIHTKLAKSIRCLSKLRKEMADEQCGIAARMIGRFQQAYFRSHIASLTYQLRAN